MHQLVLCEWNKINSKIFVVYMPLIFRLVFAYSKLVIASLVIVNEMQFLFVVVVEQIPQNECCRGQALILPDI